MAGGDLTPEEIARIAGPPPEAIMGGTGDLSAVDIEKLATGGLGGDLSREEIAKIAGEPPAGLLDDAAAEDGLADILYHTTPQEYTSELAGMVDDIDRFDRQAASADKKRDARAIALKHKLHLPTDVIKPDLEWWEAQVAKGKVDPAKLAMASPRTVEFFRKDPSHPGALWHERERMSNWEGTLRYLFPMYEGGHPAERAARSVGSDEIELGKLSWQDAYGDALSPEEEQQRNDVRQRLRDASEVGITSIGGDLQKTLYQMSRDSKWGLLTGGVGLALGAAVGLLGGPLAEYTVPAAASWGGSFGASLGMGAAGGQRTAGLLFDDMMQGGADRDTAKAAALAGGVLSGALDVVGFKGMGHAAIGGSRALSRLVGRETLASMAKAGRAMAEREAKSRWRKSLAQLAASPLKVEQRLAKGLIAEYGESAAKRLLMPERVISQKVKDVAIAFATEGLTEGMQELIETGAKVVGRVDVAALENDPRAAAKVFDALAVEFSKPETWEQAGRAALIGGLFGGMFGGAGATITLPKDMTAARLTLAETQKDMRTVRGMVDDVRESLFSGKLDPETAADFINESAPMRVGRRNVFVPMDVFVAEAQAKGSDPAAFADTHGVSAQFAIAQEDNHDTVVMPIGQYTVLAAQSTLSTDRPEGTIAGSVGFTPKESLEKRHEAPIPDIISKTRFHPERISGNAALRYMASDEVGRLKAIKAEILSSQETLKEFEAARLDDEVIVPEPEMARLKDAADAASDFLASSDSLAAVESRLKKGMAELDRLRRGKPAAYVDPDIDIEPLVHEARQGVAGPPTDADLGIASPDVVRVESGGVVRWEGDPLDVVMGIERSGYATPKIEGLAVMTEEAVAADKPEVEVKPEVDAAARSARLAAAEKKHGDIQGSYRGPSIFAADRAREWLSYYAEDKKDWPNPETASRKELRSWLRTEGLEFKSSKIETLREAGRKFIDGEAESARAMDAEVAAFEKYESDIEEAQKEIDAAKVKPEPRPAAPKAARDEVDEAYHSMVSKHAVRHIGNVRRPRKNLEANRIKMDIDRDPAVEAMRELRQVEPRLRLSRKALLRDHGPAADIDIPKNIAHRNGTLTTEDAARMYHFRDAATFLEAMKNVGDEAGLKQFAKDRLAIRMNVDGKATIADVELRRMANRAIHTESREEHLHGQLKAMTGNSFTAIDKETSAHLADMLPSLDEMRANALDIVQRRLATSLVPEMFLGIERTALREASDALDAKDHAEGWSHLLDALHASLAYRAAFDVEARIREGANLNAELNTLEGRDDVTTRVDSAAVEKAVEAAVGKAVENFRKRGDNEAFAGNISDAVRLTVSDAADPIVADGAATAARDAVIKGLEGGIARKDIGRAVQSAVDRAVMESEKARPIEGILGWRDAIRFWLGHDPLNGRQGNRKASLKDTIKQLRQVHKAKAEIPRSLFENEALAADPKSYARMDPKTATVGDILDATDAMISLTHVNARLTGETPRKVKLKDVVARLKASLRENAPKVNQKSMPRLRALAIDLQKVEFLCMRLDGDKHGVFWRNVYLPMAQAADRRGELWHRDQVLRGEIFNKHYPTKEEQAALGKGGVVIPELRGETFTKERLLMLAFNWVNDGNRKALLRRHGYKKADVFNVLDTMLDERDANFVQAMVNHIDQYADEGLGLLERLTGIKREKVLGARTVIGGKVIDGGYFPIMQTMDKTELRSTVRRDLHPEGRSIEQAFGRDGIEAMPRHHHLKERSESDSNNPLELTFHAIDRHLDDVTHDLAFRESVMDINAVLNDGGLDNLLLTKYGGEGLTGELSSWLQDVATRRTGKDLGMINSVVKHANRNAQIVALGYKASTALIQLAGYTISVKELGGVYALRGLRETWGKPAQIVQTLRDVYEMSPQMRDRMKHAGSRRDVMDMVMKYKLPGQKKGIQVLSRADEFLDKGFRQFAFYAIGMADMAVSLPTWVGAFQKAMDGKVAGFASGNKVEAALYADSAVRLTQGAGGTQDLSKVQRMGQFMRAMTSFYHYGAVLAGQYGQVYRQGKRIRNPVRNPGDLASFVFNLVLVTVIPLGFEEALRWALFGDDDDDKKRLGDSGIFKAVTYGVQAVPFARNVIRFMEYGDAGALAPPALEMLGKGVKASAELITDEFDDDGSDPSKYKLISIAKGLGVTVGLPAQVFTAADALIWHRGQYELDSVEDVIRLLIANGRKRR